MGACHSKRRDLVGLLGLVGLLAAEAVQAAGPAPFVVAVEPRTVRPGDVVLVTVKTRTSTVAAEIAPTVTAALGDRKVHLRPVRGGFQGIAAVPNQPVASATLEVRVAAGDAEVVESIALQARTVEEVALAVEEEFVDPPAEIRKVIEADRAAIAAAFRPVAPDLVVDAPFIWPRPRRITAPFGQRRMFNGTLNSEHQGVDLPGKPGDDVRAANEGTVVLSRELFYSGKTVLIDHGGGVFTGYFHLSDLSVSEDDVIPRGKVIGQVGSTGRVTGPHLHYAVRVDGQYVDPVSFMKLRLRPPAAEAVDTRAARLQVPGQAAREAEHGQHPQRNPSAVDRRSPVINRSNMGWMIEAPNRRIDRIFLDFFFGGSTADWSPSRNCSLSFGDVFITKLEE